MKWRIGLMLLIALYQIAICQPGSPLCLSCLESSCPEVVFAEWESCVVCFLICQGAIPVIPRPIPLRPRPPRPIPLRPYMLPRWLQSPFLSRNRAVLFDCEWFRFYVKYIMQYIRLIPRTHAQIIISTIAICPYQFCIADVTLTDRACINLFHSFDFKLF